MEHREILIWKENATTSNSCHFIDFRMSGNETCWISYMDPNPFQTSAIRDHRYSIINFVCVCRIYCKSWYISHIDSHCFVWITWKILQVLYGKALFKILFENKNHRTCLNNSFNLLWLEAKWSGAPSKHVRVLIPIPHT